MKFAHELIAITLSSSSASKPNAVAAKMISIIKFLICFSLVNCVKLLLAADYPSPTEGDYTLRDFKFASGETLPELRIHYRTLGKPEKDAQGKTTNAVLITHGTTGSGAHSSGRNLPANFSARVNRSMRRNSSSCCRMESATANRVNRAMGCTRNFRITAIATWSRRSIACLPKASA